MNKESSGGISVFTVLTIVFVVLKLVEVINWSWWLVLSPTWIPLALIAVLSVIAMIGASILKTIKHKK